MANIYRTLNPVKTIALSLLLLLQLGFAAPCTANTSLVANNLDTDIITLLRLIETNQLEAAVDTSASLRSTYPGSNAIALIYADLRNMLALQSVSMAPLENYSQQMLRTLNEIKARLNHNLAEPSALEIPTNLLKVKPETQHIIAVDLNKSRLYLLERSQTDLRFRLREHHYVSIGLGGSGKQHEGDLRTPIGIYNINGFKPDNKLPTLYGTGAFTLNYPNPVDKLAGRTGSGIWLHGMPHEQLSRPPQDSEGCIVLQNDLIDRLIDIIDKENTPVLLSDSLQWHQADTIDQSILNSLEYAISQQNSKALKTVLQEVLLLPKGSAGPKKGAIYRVRFLLHEYPEPDSSNKEKTQYWWKSTDEKWSILSEEA